MAALSAVARPPGGVQKAAMRLSYAATFSGPASGCVYRLKPRRAPSGGRQRLNVVRANSQTDVLGAPPAQDPQALEAAKRALMMAIGVTNRGLDAGAEGRAVVAERQIALERFGGTLDIDLQQLAGKWRLVYTTAPDVVGVLQVQNSGLFEVGDIFQEFTADGKVDNVIKLSVPFFLQPKEGMTFRVGANYVVRGPRTIALLFQEAKVGELRISELTELLIAPAFLPRTFVNMQILMFLRELELKFPLRGTATDNLPGPLNAGTAYQLTFLDEQHLVGRAAGSGGSFIFERVPKETMDIF